MRIARGAKAKFGELIQEAQSSGPQSITRNGRLAAVLASADINL
jgi:prevent-host-death family protein